MRIEKGDQPLGNSNIGDSGYYTIAVVIYAFISWLSQCSPYLSLQCAMNNYRV